MGVQAAIRQTKDLLIMWHLGQKIFSLLKFAEI